MPSATKHRIIIAGHAGLRKSRVLDRFCEYLNRTNPKQKARWYSAEGALNIHGFLNAGWQRQLRSWEDSLANAIYSCEKEKPYYAFLSMHLSYQRFSHLFTPLSWYKQSTVKEEPFIVNNPLISILRKFKPQCIVTLIDDAAQSWARIKDNNYNMSLREILVWRDIEISLAEYISQNVIHEKYLSDYNYMHHPFEKSPVISIRHPFTTLSRYLFRRDIPRVYLSYPMTVAHRDSGFKEELRQFRIKMHGALSVFDPATIDDGSLNSAIDSVLPLFDGKNDTVNVYDRGWELWNHTETNDTLIGERRSTVEIPYNIISDVTTPITVGIKNIIDSQIERRDYRLIDQSDCVVCYRPTYGKEEYSGGTSHEWNYAIDRGKVVYFIRDEADKPLDTRAWRVSPAEARRIYSKDNLRNKDNQGSVVEKLISDILSDSPELTINRMKK